MKIDKTSIFILKPPHFAAESAVDYLLRVFSANGRTWSMQHLEMAGTSRKEIQSIQAGAIHAVEHLTGRHIDNLKLSTPIRMDAKSVKIAGQIIHRDHWTTDQRRWCPVCWQEDMAADSGNRPKEWNVHRRFWWNVAAIGTCPYHQVRLRDVCPHPECERPVHSYIGGLHQCRGGHSLLTAEPDFVDPTMTTSDTYLLARLTGAEHEAVPLLDQLSLGKAIDAITRLGAAVAGGADINLKSCRGTREVEMMAVGFNIAKNWPHAFVEHLKGTKLNPGWASRKSFNQLYRWVKDLGGSSFAEELRQVFFGCMGEGQYVKPNSRIHAYVSNYVPTLKDVCKELGISSPTAHRYLEALGHPIVGSKKGTPAIISEDALASLRAVFIDQMDLRSAAQYLGIARTHLRVLVEAGRIVPTAVHEEISRNVRYFAKSELDRVQSEVLAGLPILNKRQAARENLVSISKVAQYSRGSGGLPGIVQKLLDGQAKASGVASWGVGLPRILLKPWALDAGHQVAKGARPARVPPEVVSVV